MSMCGWIRVVVGSLLFAGACTQNPASVSAEPVPVVPAPSSPEPATPVVTAPASTRLLGVLRRQGVATCPPPGQQQWVGLSWAVGEVALRGEALDDGALEPLRQRPVILFGEPLAELPPQAGDPPTIVPCPVPQLRSDWVETPDGIHVQRHGAAWPGLAVTEVRAWSGLRATRRGDEIVVELTHDLGPEPLTDVAIVAHYDGCYGKPGSTEQRSELGVVAAGALVQAVVPTHTRRGDHDYVAVTIALEASQPGLVVDLAVRLRALEVADLECPRRH